MNMSIGGPAGRTGTRHDSVTTLTPRSNFRPCPATGVARARERSTLCRRRPCANLHLPAPICTQVIRVCLCCHSGSATRPPNPRRARSALAVARLLCARCLSVWPVLARGPFTSPNGNRMAIVRHVQSSIRSADCHPRRRSGRGCTGSGGAGRWQSIDWRARRLYTPEARGDGSGRYGEARALTAATGSHRRSPAPPPGSGAGGLMR